MNYKQLIEGQRYQIEAYLREGFSYREIGKRLKVSHSTISREVNRNRIRDNHKNTGQPYLFEGKYRTANPF
ncbi:MULTISPECIES: helix-turn-helix domain-containing protein [Shewanella]|uniref:helix-turn-helix domain-containing protein n=1 Tax=Shewanella TaxID=22 RepID=UPI00386BAE86